MLPEEKHAAKDIRIEEAAECINSAERPFIYFGGGLLSADAKEEMLALARESGIVMMSTTKTMYTTCGILYSSGLCDNRDKA